MILFFLACARSDLDRVLADEAARHPRMQVEDIYKLLYQRSMGPEHLMSDPNEVRGYLEQEVASLTPGLDEPEDEVIDGADGLVRVNLREYVGRGGDVGKLATAFVATAHAMKPDRERLVREMDRVDVPGWPAYAASRKAAGLPPGEHSAAYLDAYHPAYRIVLRAELP